VGAGLLIRSFQETRDEVGLDGEQVLLADLSLSMRRYPEPEMWQRFWDDLLEWAEGQPGVTEASWGGWVPFSFATGTSSEIEGVQYLREEDHPFTRYAPVRPGFFRALGVSPSRGRLFDDRDRTGPPVAIVNELFAQRHFPGEDPLGRRIRLFRPEEEEPWRTVVGVVPDLRMSGTSQNDPGGFYFPSPPYAQSYGRILLRAQADPVLLAPPLRDRVADMDPEQPVEGLETLADWMDRQFWFVSVIGSIFTTFGAAALFLAAVGLYGVMAHGVSRRTRELGVRMALGASRGSVRWLVFREGLTKVAIGLALGMLLAWWGSRLLADVLYGVRPGDPMVMVQVAIVLLTSAVLALIVPALRATSLSPVEALRGE
jgi:putative ABC transport system permease protein